MAKAPPRKAAPKARTKAKTEAKPRGRPSLFSPEVGLRLCQRLVECRSLVKACATEDMPSQWTVYNWVDDGEADIAAGNLDTDKAKFSLQFARAKQMQADAIFEEILVLADDNTRDMQITKGKDGELNEVPNRVSVHRSELQVNTRLALAERLNPGKYAKTNKLANADGKNLPAAQIMPAVNVTIGDAKPHEPGVG